MANCIGIDFGTTNSAACSLPETNSNKRIPIYYGDDENLPLPSVVAINKQTGEFLTGREVKNNRNSLVQTHEYFASIKTIIDSDKKWIVAEREYTAENIATELFKSLKRRVEKDGNKEVTEAVVAVPVGFSPKKKLHLRNAIEEADIDVRTFISEPTAAFLSNYDSLKGYKTVAVFDWGGGTLDVVVLEISNGNVSELSSEGWPYAGDYLDEKIANNIHSNFMRNKQSPVSFDNLEKVTKDRLVMECEKIKRYFTDEDVGIVGIIRYDNFGSLRETIEYKYFSLLIEKDIENAIACLEKAIEKSGKAKNEIDCILCVGGSSRLRPLREKLAELYDKKIYYPESVMWNIAKGAAITALEGGHYTLNKPIGLLLSDGTFYPLLGKGQSLPCKENKLYFGTVDSSKKANIIITDSGDQNGREFSVPLILTLSGEVAEKIVVQYYVDENMVFRMRIKSNEMPDESGIIWAYEKLKIGFKI